MKTKELLERFSRVASPSGYEYMAEPDIRKIIDGYFQEVFDEVFFDKFGGVRLGKHASTVGRDDPGAPHIKSCVNFSGHQIYGAPGSSRPTKIMLDAHIDQVGLVVSEILDGGFLRVKPLGGLDLNILPASEFYVYTYEENEPFIFSNQSNRKIPAVAVSVPPHLKKTTGDNLPKLDDIYLDTGYDSKDELEKIVRIGSPVTFKSDFLSLENNLFSCAGMDDRLCGLILMLAVKSLKNKPEADIYIVLSTSEETRNPGAANAAYEIQPDFAVALDVDFSRDPGIDATDAIEMGKGAGITYSAATNIRLTKKIISLAKDKKIPVQINALPADTSTNADTIQITGEGIPCALVSVPLKNMHTFNEICSLKDIETTVELVKTIIENAGDLI